jgi:L-lactate dehydrogenase (cytochrome)/(S)-mandelate dehydrogenase
VNGTVTPNRGRLQRDGYSIAAVALGATACLIGRPHLWGLGVAGEAGVAQVLEILRRDIDRVLALGGWDGLTQLDRSALAPILTPPSTGPAAISGQAELPAPRRVLAAS